MSDRPAARSRKTAAESSRSTLVVQDRSINAAKATASANSVSEYANEPITRFSSRTTALPSSRDLGLGQTQPDSVSARAEQAHGLGPGDGRSDRVDQDVVLADRAGRVRSLSPTQARPLPRGGARRVGDGELVGRLERGDGGGEQAEGTGSDHADASARRGGPPGDRRALRSPRARSAPPPPSRATPAAHGARCGARRPGGEAAGTLDSQQLAVPAEVRLPAQAQVAGAAGDQRVDGDATTFGVETRDLVSHHQRRLAPPGARDAVQVAAAHADRLDVHDHIGVGCRGVVHVQHLHLVRGGEDQSAHGHLADGVYRGFRAEP